MERYWSCWIKFLKCNSNPWKYFSKIFSNLFTDVFNSIYNQQIDQKSARNVIIGFFVVAGVTTAIVAGVKAYKDYDFFESKVETKKPSAPIKKRS